MVSLKKGIKSLLTHTKLYAGKILCSPASGELQQGHIA